MWNSTLGRELRNTGIYLVIPFHRRHSDSFVHSAFSPTACSAPTLSWNTLYFRRAEETFLSTFQINLNLFYH